MKNPLLRITGLSAQPRDDSVQTNDLELQIAEERGRLKREAFLWLGVLAVELLGTLAAIMITKRMDGGTGFLRGFVHQTSDDPGQMYNFLPVFVGAIGGVLFLCCAVILFGALFELLQFCIRSARIVKE